MSSDSSFDEYLNSLGRLTAHIDPTSSNQDAEDIKEAADSLSLVHPHSIETLADWANAHPTKIPVLGLTVGLSQEKLKNALKEQFDTAGWVRLAQKRSIELITWFDEEFDLVRLTNMQTSREYTFGELLVARAGSRVTATRAGKAGRKIEDEIEAIARDLGLEYETRTRFVGRGPEPTPCDLVIPSGEDAQIVVAAKGFDSTGSKLSDAFREIEEMAAARLPRQFVIAIVDGIGWNSRKNDLRRIHDLWESKQIDGLYTLASLDAFREDIEDAARLRRLL